MFSKITPTSKEIQSMLPGDDIVPEASVVMGRVFTLPATPEEVWLWLVQLGKNRAGWCFPMSIEWLFVKGARDSAYRLEVMEPSRW